MKKKLSIQTANYVIALSVLTRAAGKRNEILLGDIATL